MVIAMYAMLATWPTECYSYSYCVGGSMMLVLLFTNTVQFQRLKNTICMLILLLLYLLYVWIIICTKNEKLGKIAGNLITISLYRSNPCLHS